MMVLYEKQIIFLISLTFPSILLANHGTITPSLENSSQRDNIFRTHMATNPMMEVANRYILMQPLPYWRILGKEPNRRKILVPVLDRPLFDQHLQRIQWFTNTRIRLSVTPNIESAPSHKNGRLWTSEIERNSVDIDDHFEEMNHHVFMLRKRHSALTPPTRDWCRLIGFRVCPRGVDT